MDKILGFLASSMPYLFAFLIGILFDLVVITPNIAYINNINVTHAKLIKMNLAEYDSKTGEFKITDRNMRIIFLKEEVK